jgi:hypothetical protein
VDTVSHFVSPLVYKVLLLGPTKERGSYYRTESFRVLDFRHIDAHLLVGDSAFEQESLELGILAHCPFSGGRLRGLRSGVRLGMMVSYRGST